MTLVAHVDDTLVIRDESRCDKLSEAFGWGVSDEESRIAFVVHGMRFRARPGQRENHDFPNSIH